MSFCFTYTGILFDVLHWAAAHKGQCSWDAHKSSSLLNYSWHLQKDKITKSNITQKANFKNETVWFKRSKKITINPKCDTNKGAAYLLLADLSNWRPAGHIWPFGGPTRGQSKISINVNSVVFTFKICLVTVWIHLHVWASATCEVKQTQFLFCFFGMKLLVSFSSICGGW